MVYNIVYKIKALYRDATLHKLTVMRHAKTPMGKNRMKILNYI